MVGKCPIILLARIHLYSLPCPSSEGRFPLLWPGSFMQRTEGKALTYCLQLLGIGESVDLSPIKLQRGESMTQKVLVMT